MKVALVWNGDKNSVLMYGKVKEKFDVSFLLTFLQEEPSHTNYLSTIKRQSKELGVPFFLARVDAPYLEEYKETIRRTQKRLRNRRNCDGQHSHKLDRRCLQNHWNGSDKGLTNVS